MISNISFPDTLERGRNPESPGQTMDRRLFIQLLAFTGAGDTAPLIEQVKTLPAPAVLYLDLGDPKGIALIWMSDDPDFFVTQGREFLNQGPFSDLILRPHLTMTGRTYALGYEQSLEETLFTRPKSRLLDPELSWAIWYPVKRTRAFESLADDEKHAVMMDHGEIGKAYGKAGIAQDIRLACHGMDERDNDFIIGVLGKSLVGPSATVQRMRKSLQTMHHIESLGPFFAGKVLYQKINSVDSETGAK